MTDPDERPSSLRPVPIRGPQPPADSLAETRQIAADLADGRLPREATFDSHLPLEARALSSRHWTPLAVAVRAAEWFDEFRIRTVLDVGSGAGKFCVAAALAGHCHFTGLEQRGRLVTCARSLALSFGVQQRVHFLQGMLGGVRLPAVDAYYFYNPFEENLHGPASQIDGEVELSTERYARDLRAVRELLSAARAGSYVLTYNGLGGKLPASYQPVCVDRELPNVLRLWRKGVHRIVTSSSAGASA